MVTWKYSKDFTSHQIGTDNQPAFTCSMLIMETLEQGVKYVQSWQ